MSSLLWFLTTFYCIACLSVNKASSTSDNGISTIQRDLSKIQNDLLALKTAVYTQLCDVPVECRPDSAFLISFNNDYNDLDAQLKALGQSVDQKCQPERNNQTPPANVVEEIRNQRYLAAQGLLLTMDYENEIHAFISDVYDNTPTNIELLLNFSRALTYTDLSYYVLKALQFEMQTNGYRNPYKLINLANAVTEVINQIEYTSDISSKARKLFNKIVDDITDVATDILVAAVYADNYDRSIEVDKLTSAIYDFDTDVSDDVMTRVGGDAYPSIPGVKIANFMRSNKYVSQMVSGLVALFRRLRDYEMLNNRNTSLIRDHLRSIRRMEDYNDLSQAQKAAVNRILH